MRVRKVKNVNEKLENYNGLLIENPTEYKGNWNKLFGNDNPIYLEIGMGKGKFINENAKRNSDINYIGLEKVPSIVYKTLSTFGESTPINLRYVCCDAAILKEVFEKDEISKIYLNFSDPWPKTRHEKRRLTNPKFLNDMLFILNGDIEFKTDNRKLFEYSLMEFNEMELKIEKLSLDLHSDDPDVITTEYEDKFTAKGNVIYYTEIKK